MAAKNDLVVLDWVELIESDWDCSDLLIVSMITGRAGLINNECIPCPMSVPPIKSQWPRNSPA